ncbi:MAG: ATP-binding protein [Acidobacteriaceae bacterium]
MPTITSSTREDELRFTDQKQRRNALIVLGTMVFLLFGVLFSQAAFNLKFLQPESNQQTFVFAGLSALLFLLFVALTFVLMRNLLKLYAETRGGVLGSRFRTKMLAGALLLSVTPTIFLFLFSYALMNRSIDKWFSRPVEELREDSQTIAAMMQKYVRANAVAEATAIADSPEAKRSFDTGNFGVLSAEMRKHDATLGGGFALALKNDEVVAGFHAPTGWRELHENLRTHPRESSLLQTFRAADGREFVVADAPEANGGKIIVGIPIPAELFQTISKTDASQQRYYALAKERKQVRQFYMMLLSLMTAAVLFAVTWLSLFISRLVTRPVAALAEAAQELSRGNLEYRIDYQTKDEFGQLIDRFNRMAGEIEESRTQVESAHYESERRGRQIEAILESIPTGVLSVDAAGTIAIRNGAFTRMFDPARSLVGRHWADAFTSESAENLKRLIRRSDRMGVAGAQLEIEGAQGPMDMAVTVAAIEGPDHDNLGHVLVFEDFSDLLRAQKQAAWQEVARRVAHEIKNPLTPISLSAERIRRYLDRDMNDAGVKGILQSCAAAISNNVESVRRLVDEFSSLAKFPVVHPIPTDVNAVVRSALAMFEGRLKGVRVRMRLDSKLPLVSADFEALKRVVANLVDNAAEAMSASVVKEITVATAVLEKREAVEITVADSGSGITPETKEKLFLPYFSTKNRGTGLGLAIASRIVEEHQGSIRAEENLPLGAKFVIELPATAEILPNPLTSVH